MIAAVHGAVVGGGFEMALACDVIIAAEDTYFMLPELQRGFLPDVGGYQWLTRKIPINVAMEMILTGRRMEVEEAQRWGLVHKIVPRSELKATALEMADRISQGAPARHPRAEGDRSRDASRQHRGGASPRQARPERRPRLRADAGVGGLHRGPARLRREAAAQLEGQVATCASASAAGRRSAMRRQIGAFAAIAY